MTNVRETIQMAAIMSLFMAAWELFIKDVYFKWAAPEGEFLSFGVAALGYFITIMVGFVVAKIIMRRKRQEVMA